MRALLCVIAFLIACGGTRSGATEALPLLKCRTCPDAVIATHSALRFSTSWEAECWESTGGGMFPVTSDSGQHDYQEPCNPVEHTPVLTCVGGECKITPLPDRSEKSNVRSFEIVVVTPGDVELRADLIRPSGKRKSLTRRLHVVRPSQLELACVIQKAHSSVWASLTYAGATLAKGPPIPEMSIGTVRCAPKGSEGGRARYLYDCPIEARDPIEVKVTGADFSLHQQTTCR